MISAGPLSPLYEEVKMSKVLVVDDDRTIRHMVRASLESQGLEVLEAEDGHAGIAMVQQQNPDVVLLDIMLPRTSGLDIFRTLKEKALKTPVIFITAGTDSSTAIETMQMGGYDYVTKPLNLPALTRIVLSAIETKRLMNTPVAIHAEQPELLAGDMFVGSSGGMLEVFKTVGRVAGQNVSVLIRGESGTGKELVARALYQHSDRVNQPFMAVNCAAIPDQLLESELFGHEKGAFTGADRRRLGKFERCQGGTIFLDEVGDMTPLVQGKVLRLLQEQRFERVGGNETIQTDVRIITATNRNLEKMVEDGQYRADLYYRLNQVAVFLPPLRERGKDIDALLKFFLSRQRMELGKFEVEGISQEALEILRHYHWPGNVRELQSVVRQSLLNTTGTVVGPSNLPKEIFNTQATAPRFVEAEQPAIPSAPTNGFTAAPQRMPDANPATTSSAPTTSVPQPLAVGHAATHSANSDPSYEDINHIVEFVNKKIRGGTNNLYAESIELLERFLIPYVLQHTGGNQSKAAELLGITRGKVRDRILTFGIRLDKSVSIDGE
jgi:DNA-binding NtrC family response regulator